SPNPPPSPVPNYLSGSTCVSSSDCWAVGYFNQGGPDQTLIEHWDGVAWKVVTSLNSSPAEQNYLYGIACTSTTNCWAAGYYFGAQGYRPLVEHWNGIAWGLVSAPVTNAQDYDILRSITCTSASNCWAVGYSTDNSSNDQTLIEHWDGSA